MSDKQQCQGKKDTWVCPQELHLLGLLGPPSSALASGRQMGSASTSLGESLHSPYISVHVILAVTELDLQTPASNLNVTGKRDPAF